MSVRSSESGLSSLSSRSRSSSSYAGIDHVHASHAILFCNDCNQILSAVCLTGGGHRNHIYSGLRDACKYQIETVAKNSTKLAARVRKYGDLGPTVSKAEKDFEDLFNRTKDKIAAEYKELTELLEQNQQQAYRLLEAEKDTLMQGLSQLAQDGEIYRQSSMDIQEKIEQLKRKQDSDDAASLLEEIKALEMSIETTDEFYSNVDKMIKFDDMRLKALESSVTKIVQRNKELLPRPWEFSDVITFNGKETSHKSLRITVDKTQAFFTSKGSLISRQQRRNETPALILADQSFHKGRHYWEVDVGSSQSWTVGVVEQGWIAKGAKRPLGRDRKSWALESDDGALTALHNDDFCTIKETKVGRLGVYLDCDKGRLKFYNISTGSCLHTFFTSFKRAVYPVFSLKSEGGGVASLVLCNLLPRSMNVNISSDVDLPDSGDGDC